MTDGPILTGPMEAEIERVRSSGLLTYRSEALPTWCPGCGYFGITHGITMAMNALSIENHQLVVVTGIGCAGRYPFFINGYGFHTIHGRALPVACGVKAANPDLSVVVISGDGDALAIGGGHLPHAIRRNVDLTFILFDNGIYGLTKGQTSPTTPQGQRTGTHPYGNPDAPLNPTLLALAYGASFVARAWAGEPEGVSDMVQRAFAHRGFSFVHVVSPCVTFDPVNITYDRLRDIWSSIPDGHDASDMSAAMMLAMREAFVTGVFFDVDRPTFDSVTNETTTRAVATRRS